jgi:hypothetical protein
MLITNEAFTPPKQVVQIMPKLASRLAKHLLDFRFDDRPEIYRLCRFQPSAIELELAPEQIHIRNSLADQLSTDRKPGLQRLAFQCLEVNFGYRSGPEAAGFRYPRGISGISLVAP